MQELLEKDPDGMLLVVHQNRCGHMVLTEAVSQFEFVGAKILGVIYNGAADQPGKYSKKYYHRSYYESSASRAGRYGDQVK